jgi:hypothetical protein
VNKNILILGGSVVASLAAGAAGGYFIAKRKFDAAFESMVDTALDNEIAKVKKYYELRMQSLVQETPTVEELVVREEPDDPELQEKAAEAMTNYQGLSRQFPDGKPDLVVTDNIFTENNGTKKNKFPPKDPTTGRFVKRQETLETPEPYIITDEEFMINDPEHEQENVLYFGNEKVVLMVMTREVVDIALLGKENLTKFPKVGENETSSIYIRNEGLEMDYDVTLTHEDLTDYMGLGESESDQDEDEPIDDEDEEDGPAGEFRDRPSKWSDAMASAREAGQNS